MFIHQTVRRNRSEFKIDSRENLGRPTTTPIENKEHFMDFLK